MSLANVFLNFFLRDFSKSWLFIPVHIVEMLKRHNKKKKTAKWLYSAMTVNFCYFDFLLEHLSSV